MTRNGLLALPVAVVIGLSALNAEINLLYLVFGLAAAAALVNLVLVGAGPARLECERLLPESASVGQPLDVGLRTANHNRMFAAWALSLEDRLDTDVRAGVPLAFVPHVPAGGSARTEYRIIPARRGRLEFQEVIVRTRFPFGLFQHKLTYTRAGSILVWPERGELLAAEPWSAGDEHVEVQTAGGRNRAGLDDFFGLRDYRSGDNPRLIHWRTSARRGKPVLRLMEERRGGTVFLLLDTRCDPADADRVRRREAAVSFAATLAEAALADGLSVGLAAWGAGLRLIPAGAGDGRRRRILDELALLEDNPTRTAAELAAEVHPHHYAGSCCVAIGTDEADPALDRVSAAAASFRYFRVGDDAYRRLFRPAPAAESRPAARGSGIFPVVRDDSPPMRPAQPAGG
jgi:uncharacterized protein (DUF58 family)